MEAAYLALDARVLDQGPSISRQAAHGRANVCSKARWDDMYMELVH